MLPINRILSSFWQESSPDNQALSETSPALPAAYSCFHAWELAIMFRQWTFAAG